jgi:hypothetical protein
MTINSPRLSTMAPPSGVDGPSPYQFTLDVDDRWRPRVAAVPTTLPPPHTTSQDLDRGSTMAKF